MDPCEIYACYTINKTQTSDRQTDRQTDDDITETETRRDERDGRQEAGQGTTIKENPAT